MNNGEGAGNGAGEQGGGQRAEEQWNRGHRNLGQRNRRTEG
jgi:hypothetical protein